MSSPRPLLTDATSLSSRDVRDNRDYEELLRKYERLQDELADAKLRIQESRNQAARALHVQAKLRQQLEPWYSALRNLFEDLPGDPGSPDVATAALDKRWETWIVKLGGKQSEFIRAMLDHGAMTREQLKISTHSGSSTVDFVLRKLKELSLIDKNGGRYSLKQL
jgi:hypothetical protein